MRIIFKKTAAVLIIALMFFSDFPAGVFEDMAEKIRDRNVVDFLWQAGRNGSVVDSFRPDAARAAEVAIDTTVNTTILRHQKSSKQNVCVSDTVCYAFYIDSDSDVVYQKSTDGGASWGGTGTDISVGTWVALAVWYDRWTPGDTTGTLVHLVYFSTADDLTYAVFNTSGDTFTANVVIASTGAQGALAAANDVAISKGTDGDLYAATVDATAPTSPASFTHKCAGTCTTASNWVSAGSNPWDGVGDDTDDNHAITLLPLPDDATHDAGDMMLVSLDIADGTVEYKVYDDSANSWSTDFTNLPVGATDSTTYTHTLSGAVDIVSGNLYVAYIHNAGTANTSEVLAAKYTGGAWSSLTDPWPDTTDGTSIVTDASIGIDSNSGDLYVVYSRGASATANDVYYAVSIDDGATWSIDNLLSSGTDRNHRAISINSSSADRLFGTYHDLTATTGNDLYGNTVADISVQDLTWVTGAADFEIWTSSVLTWDTGTLLCSGTLTDTNTDTISCSSGSVANSTQYRVQVVLKNSGGSTSKMKGASDFVDHVAVKAGWAGTNPTLGTCGFNDLGSDDGSTTCSAAWNATNDVRITNTGTGNVAIQAAGNQGFMYLITTDSDVPSSDATSYMNASIDSISEDSSKITISGPAGGTLTTDIVDASYVTVGSPTVAMNTATFNFTCQTVTGSFGTASQQIYINNNNGANNGWTLTVAAQATTNIWDSAGTDYDFNDPTGSGCTDGGDAGDSVGGQMTVDPSVATLAVGQCGSCTTANVSKGSSAAFNEGTTDTITLLSATAASDDVGDWKLTGVSISQKIPAEQPAASDYDINMVLTVTAN